ncbi:TetR/AcrR family transcriptional regulator [Streptomyces sp. WAC 06738]|uniref:TetR/AcrR family transcriptional regulator n=1 Tax=Streptomyces sp. WAC 06738 TaxID=2203210 RepID=UPI000F6E17F6|nr:TetR/AcrR family transcriptional regulator [Streptomyces sp. WAC 06738]AZM48689.1 TetR/AcrR family transcriptional regulator [Streptomyces sp. WAC 06738]
MARVSQAHLDARRRQILDGARRCFTRNGFHATSMQDVFQETGLSSGAVYRYFRGKSDLITAVAEEAFERMRLAFESASHEAPLRPLADVIDGVLTQVLEEQARTSGVDRPGAFAELIVQVWSETLRDEGLAATLNAGYDRMRAMWGKVVRTYQDAGHLRADVPTDHLVRALMALVQGFIVQQAVFKDVEVELRSGLRALLSPHA